MDDIIYILYDSTIENEESLSKFLEILGKAKYDLSKVQTISFDSYLSHLESNDFSFSNFVLCLNQTYKKINSYYSEKLNVPIFDFFSKEYINNKKQILLFGLLFNIDTIYQEAYKRYAWNFINKFHEQYLEKVKDIKEDVVEEDFEYLDNYVVEKQSESISIESKETTKELVKEEIKDNSLSYSELLEFYNNASVLFKQFNLIQNQLKLLNKYEI